MSILNNPFEKLHGKLFEIHATTESGSRLVFKDITVKRTQHPSYKFLFICLSKSVEKINSPNFDNHYKTFIYSLTIEGIKLEFENCSKIIKEQSIFGEDESRTKLITRDSIEIFLDYSFRKLGFHFQIALLDDNEVDNSIIIKFYGLFKLEYRYYQKIKKSFLFFLSYAAGNNLRIRSETFQFNANYYINEYSFKKIKKIERNEYLPIDDIHFRHKNILQNYFNTFENYLILDKHLNISGIIYLINQSKKVNIESSFFILLIAIEKLSDELIKSSLIDNRRSTIVDKEKFNLLFEKTKLTFENSCKSEINKKDYNALFSKLSNINFTEKTDYKVKLLLEFAEIKLNENIENLFPYIRNIAIHEGNIDFPKGNAVKNYETLSILVNEVICNLFQYKGIRFIKNENRTNYIAKKEDYKIDYKNYH